ncbi:hypothetical protein KITKAT_48 [Arthrobacter phage Kitkat]|uniref:Uncharacterized protein n=3 Tax=Kelleziovirus TaxID=1982236 RepID=A0A140G6D1_9CAUD|nr:hypothetical protein BJD78_gp46 [Arthrobacter phage KellEzio]YP_009303331.1 hypothetical protein BJD77_gp048 [Arthrobacter phage Kitkat]AMM44216.1 hypothetical protein KELLEZIO_46 [Arthrobacter phage KellEzio]AMM44309.1 hypothetical protein KITKAT_48 [Arthrobacter phage Kitkat]QGJ96486.1 hypothetical protein SEA_BEATUSCOMEDENTI_47 [Arthrobacter phage BeatusComedenti]
MNWGTEKKPLELTASFSKDRPKNIQSIQQQLIDAKFPAKADEFRKYATEQKHREAAIAAAQHPLTYAAERIGFTLHWS